MADEPVGGPTEGREAPSFEGSPPTFNCAVTSSFDPSISPMLPAAQTPTGPAGGSAVAAAPSQPGEVREFHERRRRRRTPRWLRLGLVQSIEVCVTSVTATLGLVLLLVYGQTERERMEIARTARAEQVVSTAALASVDAFRQGRLGALRHLTSVLRSDPDVLGAIAFGTDGRTLTDGTHDESMLDVPVLHVPPPGRIAALHVQEDRIHATAWSIDEQGDRVGGFRVTYERAQLGDHVLGHKRNLLVVGVALLLGVGLVSWFARRALAPLRELAAATHRVAEGDLEATVHVRNDDEVGEFAWSFNRMVMTLRQSTVRRDQLESINVELRQARKVAESSARTKAEFLANMSHEIRTPMTAILGYAELLVENQDPAQARAAAETIRDSGEHLLSVLDDILDLSKFEAGRLTVEELPVDPQAVSHEVVALLQRKADQKQLAIRVEHNGPIPARIRTDPKRCKQILLNLAGNAVKFTEHGSITIRLAVAERHGRSWLAIHVLDTGIGMSAAACDTLFEPFTQADSTTTRRFGGTGLGLALSQRFAHALGGWLDVESTQGEGSTFSLFLPCTKADLATPWTPSPQSTPGTEPVDTWDAELLRGRRILLAEDGADNRRLIEVILRKSGLQVESAENGRLAIERLLEARAAGKPFDLVLMDMHMPEMDGYTATRALREHGVQTPIVALTAHAMSGEEERCLEAGCDAYATKPIRRAKLIRVIARWLEPNRAGSSAPKDRSPS